MGRVAHKAYVKSVVASSDGITDAKVSRDNFRVRPRLILEWPLPPDYSDVCPHMGKRFKSCVVQYSAA